MRSARNIYEQEYTAMTPQQRLQSLEELEEVYWELSASSPVAEIIDYAPLMFNIQELEEKVALLRSMVENDRSCSTPALPHLIA